STGRLLEGAGLTAALLAGGAWALRRRARARRAATAAAGTARSGPGRPGALGRPAEPEGRAPAAQEPDTRGRHRR
ncbi:D-alanyl-D-alanine carboxypeptidase, partial [Streptomyces sp. NPDC007070]